MTYRLLSIYLSLSAFLVLLLQALSVFSQVVFWPVLLGAVLGVVLVARCLIPHPRTWRESIRTWRVSGSFQSFVCPATVPFIIILPPLVVLLIVQGWHFPPNDWDSMTYHLARAAYWRQNHTVAHFITNSVYQVAYPGNVEVLFTVLLVLMHSAQAAFMVQIAAYIMGSLAVYGVALQAGVRPAYAVFGAGLFATMPEVVLQSNGVYVDITVASYIIGAAYFFIDAIQVGRPASVICVGLALGMAVGAKSTALLAFPGLMSVGVFLAFPRTRPGCSARDFPHLLSRVRAPASKRTTRIERKWFLAYTAAALAAVALAAPWYIENIIDFGAWSGPAQVTSLLVVPRRSALSFAVNLWRHLIAFLDPAGAAMIVPSAGSWFYRHVDDLRAWLAATTGARTIVPAIEYPNWPYSTATWPHFNMLRTWYGFTGAITVYLSIFRAAWAVIRRRASVETLCATGATSVLLFTVLLLRWQPWEGHYLTTMVALGCPVVALSAERVTRRRVGACLLCAVSTYAAVGAITAVVLNEQRPLSAWGDTYNARQAAWYAQVLPVLDATDRLVPAGAHVAIMFPNTTGGLDWEFPVFGRNLTRTVIPIRLPLNTGDTFPGTPAFTYAAPFNYLIAHVPDAVVGQLFASRPDLKCMLLQRILFQGEAPYTYYRCEGITVTNLYAAAFTLQSERDFSGELLQLDEVARTDPDYQDTQFARGWALWNTGQPAAAIAAYREYVKNNPNNAQAEFNLGYSLMNQGRCGEAIAPLKKVLELQPTNAAARRDLRSCQGQ